MDSVQKLVKALEEKHSHRLQGMIRAAKRGDFSDTLSKSATPIMDLVDALRKLGLDDLAFRAINGEFDATAEEWAEWEKTPEGIETLTSLGMSLGFPGGGTAS